jgi:hypothetical protein
MAGVPKPAYQQIWIDKRSLLKNEYQSIVKKYLDVAPAVKLLFKVVCDIEDLSDFTPAPVGPSEEWATIISSAEEGREHDCNSLGGKTLFSALYETYKVTMNELQAVMKTKHQAGQIK